jgi:GPI mannosyltransferase 3
LCVARPGTSVSSIAFLAREATLCGSAVLAFSLASDRLYYGMWAFPPYSWLYFNISQSLAVFYGQNAWHYYLSQGIPLSCTTYVVWVARSLYLSPPVANTTQRNALMVLVAAVASTIGALSLISHKEVRFIYPLLPLLHVIAAPRVAAYFSVTPRPTAAEPRPRPYIVRRPLLVAIAVVNLILATYLSFLQQSAAITVMAALRRAYLEEYPQARLDPNWRPDPRDGDLFALFLMPCHSTPWRSHLVYPGLGARALTCEPPLHTAPNSTERAEYRDEADRFYDGPAQFMMEELWPVPIKDTCTVAPVPKYIVAYPGIQAGLDEYLDMASRMHMGWQIDKYWVGWNGYFHEDWRRRGDMIIWKVRKSYEIEDSPH